MKIGTVSQNNMVAQNKGQAQDATEAKASEAIQKELSAKQVNNEARNDIKADNVISDDVLEKAVEQANKALESYNKVIERTVHETTHVIMYVLRDQSTKEIIREFPPKKIQDMIAKMWELAGLLVDERR